jgi:cytidine deaminase
LAGSAILSPAEFTHFCGSHGISEGLHLLVEQARGLSQSPISQYRVGAVALGLSGAVYLGFNMELQGLGLQHTVHAEQAAVALAHWRRELALTQVAVSAPPCGHCRQFLRELQTQNPLHILLPDHVRIPLGDLLPHSFGPEDLGQHGGMLEATAHLPEMLGQGAELARAAALCSWSPYTQVLSGVALRCEDRWFPGSYLENAAFNPSLNPMQYALVLARSHGFGLDQVEEIHFWEKPSGISLYPSSFAVAEVLPRRPDLIRSGP